MADISDTLKELRTAKSVTQSEIADILHLKTNAYQAYERGASQPSCNTLIALADYYGVTTDHILGRDSDSIMDRLSERDRDTFMKYLSLPEDLRSQISDLIKSLSEHLSQDDSSV